jgi:glucosamine-6-phosphate deaminase
MQTLEDAYLTLNSDELVQASKIKIQILEDAQTLHIHFARAIADEIKANNFANRSTRLILPVGPVHQYPLLVQICNQERISWRNVHTFNMDEYCDWQGRAIPIDHPLSFEGFMRRVVFDQLDAGLGIPEDNIHFPDPLNLDSISRDIADLGGIDTCYGGIGYHGHVAFNEPPVSRWYSLTPEAFQESLTRIVHLAPESIVMNSFRNTGGNSTHFPPLGVTLGMRDIFSAARIRLYCDGGSWQRHILRIACLGVADVDYPVTLLQDHPDYILTTDQDTATPPIPTLGL